MTELKPCPFCGSAAWSGPNETAICSDGEILERGFRCPSAHHYVSVEFWQTRAPTPEREALRELLKAISDGFLLRPQIPDILRRNGIHVPARGGWRKAIGEHVEPHGIQLPAPTEESTDE